jgi:hypothetical protein
MKPWLEYLKSALVRKVPADRIAGGETPAMTETSMQAF